MEETAQRLAAVTCQVRHAEQSRPASDRIVDDPLAHRFVRQRSRWWGQKPRLPPDQAMAALCLHRLMDESMARFLSSSAPGQVVVLGAGYDSRAWRMVDDLDGRSLYEVDTPAVLSHKADCLGERPLPLVQRVSVPLAPDASLSSALVGAGLMRGIRTLFLWELGALFQSRAAVKATLSTLRSLGGAGSQLVMGGWRWPDLPTEPRRTTVLGEPLCFLQHPEDVGPFLRRQGFGLEQIVLPSELARRYVSDDRPPSTSGYGIIARRR